MPEDIKEKVNGIGSSYLDDDDHGDHIELSKAEEAANTSEHSDVFISNSNINATLKFTGNCNCSLSSNSAFITNELSALTPGIYNTVNKNNHRYMYDGTEWIKVV